MNRMSSTESFRRLRGLRSGHRHLYLPHLDGASDLAPMHDWPYGPSNLAIHTPRALQATINQALRLGRTRTGHWAPDLPKFPQVPTIPRSCASVVPCREDPR